MPEYAAVFPAGFESLMLRLPQWLRGARVRGTDGGMVRFSFPGDERALLSLPCFGNVFHILYTFDSGASFGAMVRRVARQHPHTEKPNGGFRIRFWREGRFVSVDAAIMREAELSVQHALGLRVDRVHPAREFWYILRRDGTGFYALLLPKRQNKTILKKGELRPELAYLLCCLGSPKKGECVCDPMAGHGAIPRQLLEHFSCANVYAFDIDKEMARALNGLRPGKGVQYRCGVGDARHLDDLDDGSLHLIVTDPPWGSFDRSLSSHIPAFYRELTACFFRKLVPGGRLVLLTAQKDAATEAMSQAGFRMQERLDVLVNGKKAAVFAALKPR